MLVRIRDFSEFLSRALASFRRKASKFFCSNPNRFVSLIHGEYLSNFSWARNETYTESFSIMFLNPRSLEVEGHFFSSRFLVKINNPRMVLDSRTGILHIGKRILIESSSWPQNW